MEQWVQNCTGYVLEAWHNATPVQYIQIILPVVVLGWYLRRSGSQ